MAAPPSSLRPSVSSSTDEGQAFLTETTSSWLQPAVSAITSAFQPAGKAKIGARPSLSTLPGGSTGCGPELSCTCYQGGMEAFLGGRVPSFPRDDLLWREGRHSRSHLGFSSPSLAWLLLFAPLPRHSSVLCSQPYPLFPLPGTSHAILCLTFSSLGEQQLENTLNSMKTKPNL